MWDFSCGCGHVERNVASPKCDPDSVRPEHCGKPMEIDWTGYRQCIEVFEAHMTTNIHPEGKPLYVRNSGDLKRFETEFGVKQVNDPHLKSYGGEFRREDKPKGRVFI